MSNAIVIEELRRIARRRPDKLLIPEDVVEAARAEHSPLHGSFCWDDDEAARQYRIWQARRLIRTTVQFLNINGEDQAVRVFVSLTPDRDNDEGGGYRELVAVFRNRGEREQLLADALAELETFRTKYARLKELSGVFKEVMKLQTKKLAKVA